ncbi:MAG: ADP-glyceromanno-heptose 6-epimerase [Alphaproteobacteria bacterium]
MLVVTGGSGFIGSNLVALLEESTQEPLVVCDDFDCTDKWRNLSQRRLYDIIPPIMLFDFLEENQSNITTVFHLGAISSTTERNVDLVLEQNFRFSKRLLQWCSLNRVRLIYASSAATYGNGANGFNDSWKLDDLRQFLPLNPYAWSKHLFDLTLAQIHEGYAEDIMLPPQIVGLKFFNVYGPNEYHKSGQMSLVPQFFKQINETGAIKLFKSTVPQFGHGEQKRDFIHVDDCAKVMLWFHQHPELSGLFNTGTGQARSFNDLATAVFKAMSRDTNIIYVDMPESLQSQYQSFTQANMEKLTQIGYSQPFLSLEEGVESYVKNYLAKENPYR